MLAPPPILRPPPSALAEEAERAAIILLSATSRSLAVVVVLLIVLTSRVSTLIDEAVNWLTEPMFLLASRTRALLAAAVPAVTPSS